MRKLLTLIVALVLLAFGFSGCSHGSCGPYTYPELMAAGENILTSSNAVFFLPGESVEPVEITLAQWLEIVNFGNTTFSREQMDNNYYNNYFYSELGDIYHDISIAFIPVGTVVPAGDYTFTFSLELRSGKKFNIPFTPITL